MTNLRQDGDDQYIGIRETADDCDQQFFNAHVKRERFQEMPTEKHDSPIFHHCEQGSLKWHLIRMGKITSSRFADVMTPKTRKRSKATGPYIDELVSEYAILEYLDDCPGSIDPLEQFSLSTRAMRWGTEHEGAAIAAFVAETGIDVQRIGFAQIAGKLIGASTDGMASDGAIIEVKCPDTKRHAATIRHGMPAEHMPQTQGGIWVSQAPACWFISYDPRIRRSLYIERVERDESYVSDLSAAVLDFHEEYLPEIRTFIKGKGK